MKKLMIAAVAVAMAAVAQAAAVTWNSGGLANGFANPDGNKITTAMGYTLTVAFFSDAAGNTKVTESSTSTANAMTGNMTATTANLFSASTTYYAQAIITDGVNENKTDILAFTTPGTGDTTINFALGSGFATSGNKWNGWTSAAAPEPTSGLLVLLGVAGLALKRKRA